MLFYISVVTVALFFGALAQLKDAPKEIPGTVGAVAHSRTCRALFLVSGTILILVAGLRYYVGTDYGAYYKQYGEYADSLWNRILTLDEPGYALISGISKWIINDGWFAIFLSSLVTIGAILATTYQHSEAIFLTLAFYIFMGCWHGSFNGTRQYLATAVFFCGLPFLMQRRFLPFCITVFLAFLCHKSAMVMVFLYFVVHRKICLRNLLITVFAVWLFSRAYEYLFTLSSFVLDDELSYNDFTTQSVNLIRIVVYSVPAVCFWAFFSRRELTELDTFMGNLMTVFCALAIVTMNSSFLQRIILYLVPFQALAIVHMLRMIKGRMQWIACSSAFLFYAGFWLYDISVRSNMIPYRWIWQR